MRTYICLIYAQTHTDTATYYVYKHYTNWFGTGLYNVCFQVENLGMKTFKPVEKEQSF